MRYFISAFMLGLFGCSSVQKMAIRTSSPIFLESTNHMTLEKDWDFFREATPANLKFTEMIYLQDPENLALLTTLIKGYAGYAYAVPETLALGDKVSGIEPSFNKRNAISFYTRALDYGVSYLQKKGIRKSDLLGEEKPLKELLKRELGKDDYTAVVYLAQAWGGLVQLQKENPAMVAHMPKIKILFDWVCYKQPNIENGICDIFYAQYSSQATEQNEREKGKELYLAAMRKKPRHLLIRLSYIVYILLPAMEVEAYETEAKFLKEEFKKWEETNRETLEDRSDYKALEHLNLYNAVAKKRLELIEQNKKKIFEG